MAKLLPIITAPDERLKKIAKPVERVDASIAGLMDDMLYTMYHTHGIGLAAPQIGRLQRIIVVDVAMEDQPSKPYKMVNPVIISRSDEQATYTEGCLSLPDQYGDITRPQKITVQYSDAQNQIQKLEADGLLSICIQHEIDHLDGVLFVDRLSKLRRDMILRKLRKIKNYESSDMTSPVL
ncbi:MAG: peptide deformylase [Alphaproteobacteria bacterium]|nr:peptide deformylase [Alphaproteobacteria bacterium]